MALSETPKNLHAPDPIQGDSVFSRTQASRSIGHAPPSDPGPVTRFRCAAIQRRGGKRQATPAMSAFLSDVRAHAVVRRPFLVNLAKPRRSGMLWHFSAAPIGTCGAVAPLPCIEELL